MNNVDAIVLLSGGLDSSTLLYLMKSQGLKPIGFGLDYGQKHSAELSAAARICRAANVERLHLFLGSALTPLFKGAQSSQVGERLKVPIGHYADESMKTTIVPNRNMLLLALAGAFAVSRGASIIGYAPHAGDHPIYPDCRPDFTAAAAQTLLLGSGLTLQTPFVNITKTDIVRIGEDLHVPFELTYSCYEGRELHCGVCGRCFERREAFREAGVADPTRYERS